MYVVQTIAHQYESPAHFDERTLLVFWQVARKSKDRTNDSGCTIIVSRCGSVACVKVELWTSYIWRFSFLIYRVIDNAFGCPPPSHKLMASVIGQGMDMPLVRRVPHLHQWSSKSAVAWTENNDTVILDLNQDVNKRILWYDSHIPH